MPAALRSTPFRGDPDVDELHSFFLPSRQYDGDTRWTFGTSLKSAYVNSFEFMNQAPVTQLWRDDAGGVQAVSRLSLGTAEWFYLAAPRYRSDDVTAAVIQQADAALELLTETAAWHTVCHSTAEIGLLQRWGYVEDGVAEVHMACSLAGSIDAVPSPGGVDIRRLDPTDAVMVRERALAQADAFNQGRPTPAQNDWVIRSLPHLLGYGESEHDQSIIAVDASGTVVGFADIFLDPVNGIGEFEPVGTRMSARRTGLAKVVLTKGLEAMQNAGMTQAIVRTGRDNAAAIAAYESVGFATTDLLLRFRKER